MKWTARRATESDADLIRAVAIAAWRETYAGLLAPVTIEAFIASANELLNVRRRVADHDLLVALEDDRIVAFADAIPESERVFLAAIYALPDQRGQGAGTALLKLIVDRHPGLSVEADVLLGNRKGETFYERRGFEPVATIEGDLFGERVVERRWRRPPGQVADGHARRTSIRDARDTDAASIADIYNEGIEDRIATLETTLRTPAERAEWLVARGPRHPVIVADDESGRVVGWGSLNPFNPRPAYEHVADFSVYVARGHRGHGVGGTLLTALIDRARVIGYHKMVLAALAENDIGRRLYERHGFSTVGIYHQQGQLDGRWVDVVVMERLL